MRVLRKTTTLVASILFLTLGPSACNSPTVPGLDASGAETSSTNEGGAGDSATPDASGDRVIPASETGAEPGTEAGTPEGGPDVSSADADASADTSTMPEPGPEAGPPGTDAGPEATTGDDAGPEAAPPGTDAGPEATPGSDAGPEATPGTDAGPEATPGTDAGPEATPGTDAGPEATPGSDAGPEAGADVVVGPDAAAEAGADATPGMDATTDGGTSFAGTIMISTAGATPAMSAGSTASATNVIGSYAGCTTLASGPEVTYQVIVTETTLVTFDTNVAGSFDTVIGLFRDLPSAATQLACNDDNPTAGTWSQLRAVLSPGTYYLVVDGWNGASGAYQVNVTTATPAPNAACAGAIAIMPGSALTGQSNANAGGAIAGTGCSTVGNTVFYSVTVPGGSAVTVTALPSGATTAAATLTALAGCGSVGTACIATNVGSGTTTASRLRLAAPAGTDTTYILGLSSSAPGTYDIAASAPDTAVANATCGGAIALSPGGALNGQSTAGAVSGTVSGTGCTTAANDLFYSITVPAGNFLTVTATVSAGTTTTAAPILNGFTACSAVGTSCIAAGSGTGTTTPARIRLSAGPGADTTYFFSLGSASAGTYDLTASAPTACRSHALWTWRRFPSPGSSIVAQSLDGTVTMANTGTGCVSSANNRYYQLTIPAGNFVVVTATVTAGTTTTTAPVLNAFTGCSAVGMACQASNSGTGTTTPARLQLLAAPTADTTYLLSLGSAAAGTYDLTASAAAPAPSNATCPAATDLTPGGALNGQSLAGTASGSVSGTGCISAANDRYYSITVPAGNFVVVTATVTTGTTTTTAPTLNFFSACSSVGTSCVASNAGSGTTTPARVQLLAPPSADTTFFFSLGSSAAGTYDLSATAPAPSPANATCDAATAVTPGTSLPGQSLGGTASRTITGTGCTTIGNNRYYTLTVPAGNAVVVTAAVTAATGTTTAPTLNAMAGCGSVGMACVGAASGSGTTTPARLLLQAATSDLSVVFALGSSGLGTYDLTVSAPIPVGGRTIMVSTAGATPPTSTGSTTGGMNTTSTYSCTSSASGPEFTFQLVVTERTAVTIDTNGSTFDTVLALFNDPSGTTMPLACNDDNGGGGLWSRISAILDPGTYTLVLDGFGSGAGTYLVNVSGSAPATNSTCAAAVDLAPGSTLTAQSNIGGSAAIGGTGCSTAGNVVFYSTTVPAGQLVTVTARTNSATTAPALSALTGCAALGMSCRATNTGSGTTTPASLRLAADPGADTTFAIALGSSSTGTFDIEASAPVAAAANATCASASSLSDGTTLTGENTAMSAAFTSPCGTAAGAMLFYTFTLPSGMRGNLTVTPASGATWTPVMRVFNSCTGTTCTATRTGTAGMPLSFGVTNSATTDQTYTVGVGSSLFADAVFDLAFTVTSPPGYVFSTETTGGSPQCDDMSMATGATVHTTSTGGAFTDDSRSNVLALPSGFAFNYWNTPVAWFSVTSNGFAQLWTGNTGTPATSFSNAALPSTSIPGGLAVFWDDMVPSTSPASAITSGTFGTAGSRRFVIEWSNWNLISGGSGPMRWQIKLFEATNVVEYHYCTLGTSGRPTGNSATVGLNNLDGSDGVMIGPINTVDQISTANFFRFTPR